MMSYTSTRYPDCCYNLLHSIASRMDFWASEASSMLGSLRLGGVFNHTEAVY